MAIPDRPVYPTQPRPLAHQIEDYLKAAESDPIAGEIFGLIVPDTNLLSGGHAAAEVYTLLQGRHYDTVVLIAPSHSGAFQRIHICSVDHYRTPLGELVVNDRLRHELCDEDDDIFLDDDGHYHTQGVDVQLPYLQTVLDSTFDIVPVVMGDESPEFCRELASALGEVAYNRRVLVVATADVLTASEEVLEEFRAAFEKVDVSRLMMLFNSERMQVVGKGPILVALLAAQHRRASKARVLSLEPAREGAPGHVAAVLWRE